jgi:hypothetical protein
MDYTELYDNTVRRPAFVNMIMNLHVLLKTSW